MDHAADAIRVIESWKYSLNVAFCAVSEMRRLLDGSVSVWFDFGSLKGWIMKKIVFALVVMLTAVSGVGSVASAGVYPPADQLVTVDDGTPTAGDEVTVTAKCAVPEDVEFTIEGDSAIAPCVATVGTDSSLATSDGVATAKLNAPGIAGTYTVSAVGSVSGDLGSVDLVVAAQVETTTTLAPVDGLPATGSDGIGLTTGIAFGVFAAGLLLFALATVRRRQPAAA
ncbi:MAG: hypothetical protein ACJA14_000186 [Ilumatobacter sp.]